MNFAIYTLKDAQQWLDALREFPLSGSDIYYHPDYYRTWIEQESGEAICIIGEDNLTNTRVLYPFLKRKIVGYGIENIYDITSAYGYGGGIASKRIAPSSPVAIEFDSFVQFWCANENVIVEFTREHPDLACPRPTLSRTQVRTNVDVRTDNLQVAWQTMKDTARRSISKALRQGLVYQADNNLETLDSFANIYYNSVKRLKMSQSYNYEWKYFEAILRYLKEQAFLVNVIYNADVIASALCWIWNNRSTYYLGGSLVTYWYLRPNDLLYWGMIQTAHERKASLLSLGGGTSNNQQDSLFRFKRKFGRSLVPVFIGKKIYDPDVYQYLIKQWTDKYPHLAERKGGYALAYREVD